MLKTIQTIKTKNLTWVNISRPGKEEIDYLRKKYGFHPLDLKECLPPLQRPKLVEHRKYLFLILQFPVFNKKDQRIHASEVDFFIDKDLLVVIHNNDLTPINEFFNWCQTDAKAKTKYFHKGAPALLHEILERLFDYCFPILNHISNDIDEVEQKIFSGRERETIKIVLSLKRNVTNFRKIMAAHQNVILKLSGALKNYFTLPKINLYYNYLIEYAKDIWDLLENYKDTANALHQTNESLLSHRTGQAMRSLNMFAVIIFPLTFIATLFAMRFEFIPFIHHPNGFWILIMTMVLIAVFMIGFYRKKKWL